MVEDTEAASTEETPEEPLEPSEIVAIAAPEQPIADTAALEEDEVEQEMRDQAAQTCIVQPARCGNACRASADDGDVNVAAGHAGSRQRW